MVKWLKVLFVEPGKVPEVRELPNNLKSFELMLGGYVEITNTARPGCILLAAATGTDGGKSAGRGEFPGTFIIARAEPPDLASLTEEDIEILSRLYA